MNSIQIITRESFIGIAVFAAWILLCNFWDFSFGFVLGVVLLLAWLWAFRNPERTPIDRGDDIILAPVDGTISNIIYTDTKVQIDIKVSFFDVGLVRAPQSIESISLQKKSGLVAYFSPLRQHLNETMRADINGKLCYGITLLPSIFKSSRFYAPIAYRLGERMGFMKIGTLMLELPYTRESSTDTQRDTCADTSQKTQEKNPKNIKEKSAVLESTPDSANTQNAESTKSTHYDSSTTLCATNTTTARNIELRVHIGDKIKGGASILGYIK